MKINIGVECHTEQEAFDVITRLSPMTMPMREAQDFAAGTLPEPAASTTAEPVTMTTQEFAAAAAPVLATGGVITPVPGVVVVELPMTTSPDQAAHQSRAALATTAAPVAAPTPGHEMAPVPAPVNVNDMPPAGELDINGIPWDVRIHAATKGKTKPGAWKRRKGVTQADHDALAATLGADTMPEPVPQTVVPTTTPAPENAVTVDENGEPNLPPSLARSPEPVAPAAPAAPDFQSTKDLIEHHTFHATPGFIQFFTDLLAVNHVESMPALQTRPELWGFFTDQVTANFGAMPNG